MYYVDEKCCFGVKTSEIDEENKSKKTAIDNSHHISEPQSVDDGDIKADTSFHHMLFILQCPLFCFVNLMWNKDSCPYFT
ncbi:hypothetical protein TNCV_3411871 [Trichonephila clavipes]|nr:hypothetical protein TNCV_3411871 [Trichonephila clavipes]